MSQGRLDLLTIEGLVRWCHSDYAPFPRDAAEDEAARMQAYLESLDSDDADYLINKGWTRVWEEANQ